TYTSDAGYSGPDSFTFRAFDGTARSSTETVNLTVTPPANHAPVCAPQKRTVAPGAATTLALSCSDPDGDPITSVEIVAGPSHGTLGSISGGQVAYTPNAGYFGADSFTYRASDGTATAAPALVTLTVQSVNPVVSLAADRTTAQAPADIRFTAAGSDPDGGTIARYVFSVDGTEVQSGPSPTLDRHFGQAG